MVKEKNTIKEFPPGSKSARTHGCSCPVFDNCRGAGRYGNGPEYGWFVTEKCKLHGRKQ